MDSEIYMILSFDSKTSESGPVDAEPVQGAQYHLVGVHMSNTGVNCCCGANGEFLAFKLWHQHRLLYRGWGQMEDRALIVDRADTLSEVMVVPGAQVVTQFV